MAKNKELTAEELIQKKIRTSNGWTRFWAILLALVLVSGVAGYGKKKVDEANAAYDEQVSKYAEVMASAQQAAANNSNNVVAGGSQSAGGQSDAAASSEAVEAAKAINDATAKAASGVGYDWARNCQFTKSVDVGSATNVLNKVIATVDKNASIDSVVGGFIGIGDNKVSIPKGQEFKDVWGYHASSYKLKATQLKPEDLQNLKVDGDTYTFTLADADTPKKDNSTPINRLTDDIVVQEEVAKEINDMVGSLVSVNNLIGIYTNVKVEVVITDGQLQKLSYSYDAEVKELALKAMGVGVKGTGAMHADATYSNFVY